MNKSLDAIKQLLNDNQDFEDYKKVRKYFLKLKKDRGQFTKQAELCAKWHNEKDGYKISLAVLIKFINGQTPFTDKKLIKAYMSALRNYYNGIDSMKAELEIFLKMVNDGLNKYSDLIIKKEINIKTIK